MSRTSIRKRNSAPAWSNLPDEKLLDVPLKSLKLRIEGTWLEDCVEQLNAELEQRGLIRAHAWLSEEWFSSPETPGIALPFALAHPRLMRLERKMMLEVEGGTRRDCMQLLRHEAGHVVQHAYDLHRRKRWQSLFGSAATPYPEHYKADPTSKRYVQYLRRWYAQCHPDEDFAETFAVWLTPRSNWKKRYAGWPALAKLEYVDELMSEIADQKPHPYKRVQVDPLSKLKITLRDHYNAKRERYSLDMPTVFDRDLRRIFTVEPRLGVAQASSVIKRNRKQIVSSVARSTGEYPIALDHAIDDMITRCRALKLRAPGSERQIRQNVTAMLNSKAIHSHYTAMRHQWFAV